MKELKESFLIMYLLIFVNTILSSQNFEVDRYNFEFNRTQISKYEVLEYKGEHDGLQISKIEPKESELVSHKQYHFNVLGKISLFEVIYPSGSHYVQHFKYNSSNEIDTINCYMNDSLTTSFVYSNYLDTFDKEEDYIVQHETKNDYFYIIARRDTTLGYIKYVYTKEHIEPFKLVEKYYYNTDNLNIGYQTFQSQYKSKCVFKFCYDDRGNKISEESFDKNRKLSEKEISYYNQENRLVKSEHYYENEVLRFENFIKYKMKKNELFITRSTKDYLGNKTRKNKSIVRFNKDSDKIFYLRRSENRNYYFVYKYS